MGIRQKTRGIGKGNGRGKATATAPTRNGQTAASLASAEYGREYTLLELKHAAIQGYLAALAARDAAMADPQSEDTAGSYLAAYLVRRAEESLVNALLVTGETHEEDIPKLMKIHQPGRAVAYRDQMYLVLPDPDCGSAYGKESECIWAMRLHIIAMNHYDDLDGQV